MLMKKPRYLLICNVSDGLVAQMNGVVVQLQLARRLGLEPIVYLHRRSVFFGAPNPYFDESQGPNVWDYYFEPIGPNGAALDELVREGLVATLSTASELARLHRWEPESWLMNPYGCARSIENRADGPYPRQWWAAQRDKARKFFSEGVIRFKQSLQQTADRFIERHFSEETLGVQLRGSDKFDFGCGPNLARKALPEEYFPYIDRYLAEHPRCQRIFVATDQRQWLKSMEAAYPDKVISYSRLSLSDTSENKFQDAAQKAARGAEVLIDVILLSRCSYLLKCHAAVGEMALTLNPTLDFIDLNYENQPYEAKPTLARFALAPFMAATCNVWRRLSERGMGLTTVASLNGDEILVDPLRPRPLNDRVEAAKKARPAIAFSRRFSSDAFQSCLQLLGDRCFVYRERGANSAASERRAR